MAKIWLNGFNLFSGLLSVAGASVPLLHPRRPLPCAVALESATALPPRDLPCDCLPGRLSSFPAGFPGAGSGFGLCVCVFLFLGRTDVLSGKFRADPKELATT